MADDAALLLTTPLVSCVTRDYTSHSVPFLHAELGGEVSTAGRETLRAKIGMVHSLRAETVAADRLAHISECTVAL